MRKIVIASLFVALTGAGLAHAADDSLDKAAKKTSDGFGNLLKGMGQEIKKAGIGDEKKGGKKKDENAAKADPNPKGDAK